MTSSLVHNEGIGSIILWYGTLETIPADWILCDGENGTPALESFFVQGAGKSFVTQSKKAILHSHTATSDEHRHNTDQTGIVISAGVNYKDLTDRVEMTLTTGTRIIEMPYHALAYIMKVA